MVKPSNAAIAYDNLSDRGAVTASSSSAQTPASRLQNPHVARKWRSLAGGSQYITIDLGTDSEIDSIAIMGISLGSDGSYRIRVSEIDPSAQDGAAYDSGIVGNAIDPRWSMMLHLIPVPVAGRYVRIDLTQPGAAYIEAGRLFVGKRWQFDYNFSFGWSRGYVDRSRRTESRGGQTYVDPDSMYRVVNLSFEYVTERQRLGFVEEIDRVNGTHEDVLLITRSDSDNLGRDTIWGLISDLDPITQPLAWINDAPAYGKTYRITERL